MFSKRTLATEKAIAYVQGKASEQCGNILTMLKHTYIREMKEVV